VVSPGATIVVVDQGNHRLRKMAGDQVTTLAGSSEAGTADGAGAVARFEYPRHLAMDELWCLLVTESGSGNTLRVVEACIALPLWMGPVEEAAAVLPDEATLSALAALHDYGKLVELYTRYCASFRMLCKVHMQ